MADLTALIETMEHSWMRAWVNRDAKGLKALTAKDFILLAGSKPPTILDRPSWIEAAAKDRWDCSSYRFGDIYVRSVGGLAVFAAPVELKATNALIKPMLQSVSLPICFGRSWRAKLCDH